MYRVRTVFNGVQGSPWLSTMFFASETFTAADAVTAVGQFWTSIQTLQGNDITWATEGDVETVDAATGQTTAVESTTPQTGAGSAATPLISIASQGLVRWRSGFYIAGREVRGRTFIPGLTSTAVDDGSVAAGTRTDIQTAADALIADANSSLVVWSRAHGQQPNAESASVWANFAVLRSRRD